MCMFRKLTSTAESSIETSSLTPRSWAAAESSFECHHGPRTNAEKLLDSRGGFAYYRRNLIARKFKALKSSNPGVLRGPRLFGQVHTKRSAARGACVNHYSWRIHNVGFHYLLSRQRRPS